MRAHPAGSATFLRVVFPALPFLSSGASRFAFLSLFAATLLLACTCVRAQENLIRPVEILASPIVSFRIADPESRFGSLRFVGGLQLQSDDKQFGGFSGIRLLPDRHRFIAVTDAGQWLAGRIDRDPAGLPRGLTDTVMGSLLSPDAGFIARKLDGDCEGLAIDGDRIFLSFERNDRIEMMKLANGLPVAGSAEKFADLNRLHLSMNKGIEALAHFPAGSPFAGALLAISEESLNRQRNIRAFFLDGETTSELAFQRDGDFAITDAEFLPSGDLLILERAYSVRKGQAMRLRHVPAGEIAKGATAKGSILLSADKSYWIDNMEGLDISAAEDGSVHLTLISDDNFSALQRTLLLEFVLER
ncbi:MAG: esterase-like activity of phytase family protein [Salaquimonas sp.]|nr:esterase-like activity of phytase family protein [Salaquimonas sp.]